MIYSPDLPDEYMRSGSVLDVDDGAVWLVEEEDSKVRSLAQC
jgi:hypothetical protein